MEARRRKDLFFYVVLVYILSLTHANGNGNGVGPSSTFKPHNKHVLIEGESTSKTMSPHISTSPVFLSQAATTKHNHKVDSDTSISSDHHVNEGQGQTLLQVSDQEKKYWFEEPVVVHMVANLQAEKTKMDNYNARHCPGSCFITKYFDCAGETWLDKGGCESPLACCTGELTDKTKWDSRVCSGVCFNEELGRCAGVEKSKKSASCKPDAPLCCSIRGTLIPFIPTPSPAPVAPLSAPGAPGAPGSKPPAAPAKTVETFKGTRPRGGSNSASELRPAQPLNVGAFLGDKLKVAQLYNYFGGYISKLASHLEVKENVLGGVLHALSNGIFAFDLKGRMNIRFNVERFWDNWGQFHQEKYSRHFGFEHEHPYKRHTCRVINFGPWKPCHKTQDMEWTMFRFAQSQNNYQAIRSVSMGVSRVRGEMFRAAGFKNPLEMFEALSGSAKAQLDAFASVMKNDKYGWCLLGLRTEKLGMFANCFNGKHGRHGRAYVHKIKKAVKLYGDVSDVAD